MKSREFTTRQRASARCSLVNAHGFRVRDCPATPIAIMLPIAIAILSEVTNPLYYEYENGNLKEIHPPRKTPPRSRFIRHSSSIEIHPHPSRKTMPGLPCQRTRPASLPPDSYFTPYVAFSAALSPPRCPFAADFLPPTTWNVSERVTMKG